jgi:sigma-E factor negative regulatory protein RseA
MSEKLSALVDNELDELERARILRELGRDEGLAERWSRYHLIGLAMRREQVSPDLTLPARVARALDDELDAGGSGHAGRRWLPFHPAGRLAIAASVVGVLLVGGLIVKLYQDTQTINPGLALAQQTAASEGMRWEGADPQSVDALNALLIEHGEFTAASGMNGLTAYTKFVAYDSR